MTRRQAALREANATWPEELQEVPRHLWPPCSDVPDRLFRSRRFLVQVFLGRTDGICQGRMSINRTELAGRRWKAGITWDELQDLKRQAGYGDLCAVEIYPPDAHVIDDANMRHLWLMARPPSWMWRSA